jgi:hypothetical protein
MWGEKGGAQSPPVRERLGCFNGGLEIGMLDNSVLTQLFAELESAPEALLPADMPALANTAFLLWKFGWGEFAKRLLYTCLAWYLKNSKDHDAISTITKNLQHIFAKEGISRSVEDIHHAAAGGHFGHAASWTVDKSALEDIRQVAELSGGNVSWQRTRFAKGLTPLVPAKMPLTTFHGWLKRLDPAVLNATGRLATEHIFPMFGEPTPQQHLARSERLAECYIELSAEDRAELTTLRQLLKEGLEVRLKRHRRFSGGDGLLPRGCYASLCKDAAGNDNGSLSRELLAYVDSRVPGTVFVGDSTSAKLNAALRNAIRVLPGFCAIHVLLFAPSDRDDRAAFDAIYRELLTQLDAPDQSVYAFAIEARVDECTTDNVIDLRLPRTQEWFFDHFKDGDGVFLVKDGGTAREFYDLVPTLLHPALGGTEVTHAIGSWMRSSGVNGLIFPSARSDASATVKGGELVDWHGWNFVDYRLARNLPATEVTRSPGRWPDFLQPGVQLGVDSHGEWAGTWKVMGLQNRYDQLRETIEGA